MVQRKKSAPQIAGQAKALTKAQVEKLEETRTMLLAHRFANIHVPGKTLELVLKFNGVTYWEELMCVGYNPDLAQLEAVVAIKRQSGYSGNLCTDGSTEYVRFFIDWQDGTGFHDVGLTSFKAYDISDAPPGPQHPISHMVYLGLDDETYRKLCQSPLLPEVRAVLGWNEMPSLNPDDIPYYGNRLDVRIQIRKKDLTIKDLVVADLLQAKGLEVLETIDFDAVLPVAQPKAMAFSKLHSDYREAKVPDHRLVYPAVAAMLPGMKLSSAAAIQPELASIADLKIDLEKVIDTLSSAEANTTYEELVCVGLNTATDMLGAVIHIKKPAGYSGSLCTNGSTEYVAFWADWNNDGNFDEYLGTASVQVHDISAMPGEGLYYSVLLPVNVSDKLKKCTDPNIVRIRAVLSWATPPSTTDSGVLNYWGNRIDALVRIRHGLAFEGLMDLIYFVGNVPIENIDPVTHLANPSVGVLNPLNCSQPAMDRPFGGRVSVRGRIYNTGAPGTVYYQVQYAPHGTGAWLPVTNRVTYRLAHPNPFDPLYPVEVRTVNSPDGWFPYQEDPTASPPILEQRAHLATWSTAGVAEGHYDLRMIYTTDYPISGTSVIHASDVVTIVVDNTNFIPSPYANTVIDMSYTLDLVIDGGDCHSYSQSATITGHLRARDKHFWRWQLELQPSTHTHGLQASPQCRSYGSLTDQGPANDAWSLSVTQGANKLDKCGYTLTLWAYDRAIVNSNGAIVHHNKKAVGFSIV